MPRTVPNPDYWEAVRRRAEALGSDGCTGVTQWRQECCLRHDIHYRTGLDMDGRIITRAEADLLFWRCMADRSALGMFSLRAAIRYLGVTIFRIWTSSNNLD